MSAVIIFTGKYLVFIIVAVAGLFWLRLSKEKKYELALLALITLPIEFIISRVLNWLYYNPRPFAVEHIQPLIEHAADNGFPSDHTLLATACAALVFTQNRTWGAVLGVLAILVGVARVAAKVHHPLDIVGSIVIAVLVTAIVGAILGQRKRHLQKS